MNAMSCFFFLGFSVLLCSIIEANPLNNCEVKTKTELEEQRLAEEKVNGTTMTVENFKTIYNSTYMYLREYTDIQRLGDYEHKASCDVSSQERKTSSFQSIRSSCMSEQKRYINHRVWPTPLIAYDWCGGDCYVKSHIDASRLPGHCVPVTETKVLLIQTEACKDGFFVYEPRKVEYPVYYICELS